MTKKIIANNKKAFHDFFILEKYECGIVLYGTEIKSLRQGKVNLKDSYCYIDKGEIFAKGVHISPYEKGNIFNKDPLREKKLLMHKKEIFRLFGEVTQKGLTLIPLSIYFSGQYAKIELGLCKGKKLYDKRETEAEKTVKMQINKVLRENQKY
ncbi:MAG: SsrA-binding protein SmpB [Clostridia bacterium]|nr:SsrA-binding protein SmpB [Clostridia bacterium]